jgi:integrase
MPRRRSPPRLYLDERQQWVIRDGTLKVRTSCAESDRESAEKRLAQYIGEKYQPKRSDSPLIADMLLAYARDHVAHLKSESKANIGYNLPIIAAWWGNKNLSDVTAANCRAYAETTKTPTAARLHLEVLRAAIGHWHREYGPLPSIPAAILPPKPPARERWLTRSEAARLLWAARRTPYLARFILIGLYTGSRSAVIRSLHWDMIDLEHGKHGIMLRRAPGTVETKKRTPPVRIGRKLSKHLRRWKRLDDPRCPLVCHNSGRPVRDLWRSWRNAVQAAGLDAGVTPHTLRHTRATWVVQAGVDLWEASGHLGMSVATLQSVYAKHSPDFQRRAAEV